MAIRSVHRSLGYSYIAHAYESSREVNQGRAYERERERGREERQRDCNVRVTVRASSWNSAEVIIDIAREHRVNIPLISIAGSKSRQLDSSRITGKSSTVIYASRAARVRFFRARKECHELSDLITISRSPVEACSAVSKFLGVHPHPYYSLAYLSSSKTISRFFKPLSFRSESISSASQRIQRIIPRSRPAFIRTQ